MLKSADVVPLKRLLVTGAEPCRRDPGRASTMTGGVAADTAPSVPTLLVLNTALANDRTGA
jgi:hypothetical protein